MVGQTLWLAHLEQKVGPLPALPSRLRRQCTLCIYMWTDEQLDITVQCRPSLAHSDNSASLAVTVQ